MIDFSQPGKPTDNCFIERFNGKFRAECLNAYWFMSLDDTRIKMEDWRRDYNEFRPDSAIGNKVQISLMNGSTASPPLCALNTENSSSPWYKFGAQLREITNSIYLSLQSRGRNNFRLGGGSKILSHLQTSIGRRGLLI